MKKTVAGVLLAAVLAAPAPAAAQYDQCGEDDIACDELWYWLGETLFLYELGVLNLIGEGARQCFEADTAAWHEKVAASCGEDAACTETAYRERLASLAPLQPGMNAAEGVAMDGIAVLATVLGPETGDLPAAAPPVPFDATGRLVWASEHIEHMGLAVDAGAAAGHVIVFDMDIGNQPGHTSLMQMIENAPDTEVLVRGSSATAPDGVANFDTEQCRLVYRLP
ncbi:hypothetical protein [Devosia nitrariae]|uniref:Uncharacterized protein n=1 Tax=Devosia nitrariae TaxID=2071872 RepID=A0ABQ5WB90_9HYPH|nr:hypothetical protein [Devosia nitrariae]GLQ57097.1 hypothetical protein GCM10010862_43560 [Devosia nitrariae]